MDDVAEVEGEVTIECLVTASFLVCTRVSPCPIRWTVSAHTVAVRRGGRSEYPDFCPR